MTRFSRILITGAALATLIMAAPAMAATPDDQLIIGTSLAQVLSLDPQQATEVKAQEILANTYDRLVHFTGTSGTDGSTIKPQLAESWEIDATGITFLLRDAEFASGNPVTSDDVVFSLVRLLKLELSSASSLKTFGYNADNIESMVSALDSKTVRIELTDDITAESLLYRLAGGFASIVDSVEVQKHVSNGDYGNEWLRTNTAGSGPYVLRRWAPNEIVMLEANEQFWGGPTAMRRVIFRHTPESQAARLMLERGDIDIANALTAADVANFANKDGFEIDRVKTGGFYMLAMNAGKEPLDNPLVREAIAHGIDYQGIAQTILGPYGRARNVPVPEDIEGAIANPDWSLQPEKARQLLAEAGYPEGFSLTLKTISETPRVDMATAIQANLAEIGITVRIQQGNGSDIIASHRARDFELLIPQTSSGEPTALGSIDSFTNNPDNSLEANNAGNNVWRSAWDIPELHELRGAANRERDVAKRLDMVRLLQEMFIEQKPAVLPMFERFEPIVVNAKVQGYSGHPRSLTRLDGVTKSDVD
ncbi:peptide/nickel transport system substrate-binding protein [Devosia crocina]|uniref:Peptide/nickel transport system substrate-binding protein n=1 Tax=Devosia crocina TaxID=429728 RepID=A0A1I7MZ72_9HYPH|nr:ABC transporter substrate-binding protein [Devosia crocina]SFV27635.1 peptide/nickel transport system substrate-binding protein [Devosia crocina]